MANTLLRDKTQQLRLRGASLNEIAVDLGIPKSTVRFWCRDIKLSKKQLQRLEEKQRFGGILAAEKIREGRLRLIEQLTKEGRGQIGRLSPRDLLIAGAALYWAEGYRKGDGEFGFTNSDPTMIKLILRWLKDVWNISEDNIHLRICINNSHRERIRSIQKFWSTVTGLTASHFSKPTLINVSNKKNYLNSERYFGTLRIKVRKSTNLKRKILGTIEALSLPLSLQKQEK